MNANVAKTYDADSKKKVVSELMPRALYWFAGARPTRGSRVFLPLGLVYYMGGTLLSDETPVKSAWVRMGVGLALLVVGFGVYDVLWKAMAKNETAGVAVSFVLLAGTTFGLAQMFSGRAVFIHIGALFGTIMAANVLDADLAGAAQVSISAIKAGTAPTRRSWAWRACVQSRTRICRSRSS